MLIPISAQLDKLVTVCVVIPARNEADFILSSLRSIFEQDYPNPFHIVLVDDNSTDDTASLAQDIAKVFAEKMNGNDSLLEVITARPLPPGWTGKLWAMEQGVRYARRYTPDYYFFTDADIKHERSSLYQLVMHAEQERLDLISLMAQLHCYSYWERFLIPPFVYFFQKLYPFKWVNDINSKTAAAAGGCMLVRRQALERIGGLNAIKNTLIDDCSLARAVKCGEPGKRHPIWIGLTEKTYSLRPYNSLKGIWNTVARTAYTQLGYSFFWLVLTVLAMVLTYWVSLPAFVWGILKGDHAVALIALATWLLMAFSLRPTLQLYRQPSFLSLFLPIIAVLYTLMTVDSAVRHWCGFGGNWKGRVYRKKTTYFRK